MIFEVEIYKISLRVNPFLLSDIMEPIF